MNHALVIARRDLAERLPVFGAAAAIATLPFLFTLLPRISSFGTKDVMTTSGAMLSGGFAMILSFALGVTMVGRDLSEKRMSFYFSKPLPVSSIWFGKLIAAVITIALCFGITFLPAWLASRGTWFQDAWPSLLPLCLALLLGGHALSTMFRSKSPLIVVDLVLVVTSVYVFGLMMRALHQGFAFELLGWFRDALTAVSLVILIGCGLWQLQRGRADRLQNHVELSRSLWVAVAIMLAIAGAFVGWVVTPAPADLREPRVFQATRGSWAMITGEARHRGDYRAWFLYDVATGKSIRLRRTTLFRDLWFSRDGKTFGYFQSEAPDAPFELVLMPLGNVSKPIETGLTFRNGGRYAFDDSNARLVFFDGGQIASVYDVPSRKSIVTVRMPEQGTMRAFFLNPDLVRIYVESNPVSSDEFGERSLTAYELDVRTRTLRRLAVYKTTARRMSIAVSPDGSRLLLAKRENENHAYLMDSRTLERTGEIPSTGFARMTFLADGSVGALSVIEPANEIVLDIYGPDAVPRRRIAVGHARRAWVSDELAGGRLIVKGADHNEGLFTAWVVDYMSGRVTRTLNGLQDAGGFSNDWFAVDPRHNVADASHSVITSTKDGLLAWLPLTGATKDLVWY